MTDRVEELEAHVAELQAAVNGLTEELVETKERVRQLEDALEERAAEEEPTVAEVATGEAAESDAGAESGVVETTTKSDDHVEVVRHERREAQEQPDAGRESTDFDAEEAPSEASKAAEEQDSEEDGESEESDIIVA